MIAPDHLGSAVEPLGYDEMREIVIDFQGACFAIMSSLDNLSRAELDEIHALARGTEAMLEDLKSELTAASDPG